MTREIKKTEALSRMEMLGLSYQAKTRFEKEDKASISDDITGTSSWAKGDDLKRIRRFEEQYKVLVYAVVRSHTQIGTIDCYLFVSDYQEEWNHDRAEFRRTIHGDIEAKRLFAYAYNHDTPAFSDFGHMGVTITKDLRLFRIW